jgi:hypothetical protein
MRRFQSTKLARSWLINFFVVSRGASAPPPLFLILIEARYAVQLESIECCVLRHELNCGSENSAIIGLTP